MNGILHHIPIVVLTLILVSCNSLSVTPVEVTSQMDSDWYSIYFTHPGEAGTGLAIESALVDSIDKAKQRIDLASYSFSLSI